MKSKLLLSFIVVTATALMTTSCAGTWWDVSDSPYDYYYDPTVPPPPYLGPMSPRPDFYPGSLGWGPVYVPGGGPTYLPDNRPIVPPGGSIGDVNGGPGLQRPPSNNIGNRRPAISNGGINRPSGGDNGSSGVVAPNQPAGNGSGGNRRPR